MGLFSINYFHELRKMDLICLLFNYIIRSLFQLFNQKNECLLNTVIRIFSNFQVLHFCHLHTSRYCDIVSLYNPWQKSILKSRDWRCLWRTIVIVSNQPDQSFLSEFSGHTIFTLHFNEKLVLSTQWEIVCNWFHMMPVEPIKYKLNFQ